METLGDALASKKEQNELLKFKCIICNYTCSKKFNFDRHLLSSKHIQLTKGDKIANKNEQNEQKYCCENCNKGYISRNGLWKHKQKCKTKKDADSETEEIKKDEITDKELIMMLIKDNSEFKNIMMKVLENGTHNTTHTNSHNKAFNLQFFLHIFTFQTPNKKEVSLIFIFKFLIFNFLIFPITFIPYLVM